MVADIRERSRKLLAALVLALVFASTLPITGAQLIPTQPDGAQRQQFELSLVQGEAVIRASSSASSPPLKFVSGNTTYWLEVTIYNSGAQSAPAGLPLYFWYDEDVDNNDIRCYRLPEGIPAANLTSKGQRTFRNIPFNVPNQFIERQENGEPVREWANGFTMRVLVNRAPVGLPAYEANRNSFTSASCGTPTYDMPLDPSVPPSPTARDPNPDDNIAVVHYVKDARLDLQVEDVKWCRGDPKQAEALGAICDQYTSLDEEAKGWFNFTSNMTGPSDKLGFNTARKVERVDCELLAEECITYNTSNDTYFEVKIKNSVENATWTGEQDLGARCTGATYHPMDDGRWKNVTFASCPGYAFDLDIRIANLTENVRSSSIRLADPTATYRGWTNVAHRSVSFQIINWTGPFQVYASVNDRGRMPEAVTTNNDYIRPDPNTPEGTEPLPPFEVKWTDFTPEFKLDELKTSPHDPYPYRPDSIVRITGRAFFRNLGPGYAMESRWVGSEGAVQYGLKNIHWTLLLDNKTVLTGDSTETGNASSGEEGGGPVWNVTFTLENNTLPGTPGYISPGRHGLCVMLDASNAARESNETNNMECVAIYLADNRAPFFDDIEGRENPRIADSAAFNGTIPAFVRPGEPFFVHSNATDDDLTNLNVTAQFTLNTNESIVRNYTLRRHASFQTGTFTSRITDFNFSTNATVENWTVRVIAADAFGNNATSPPSTLQLRRWPVQTVNESTLVLGIPTNNGTYYPDNTTFNYTDEEVVIRYRVVVQTAQTGVEDQPNVTANLGMRVFTPKNTSFYLNGSYFEKLINCPQDDIPLNATKTDVACSNIGHFRSPYITKSDGGPGRWYVHLEITDKGGDTRVINQTFVLLDAAPTIWDTSISANELEAGQTLTVRANMTDDFGIDVDDGDARVNFTRRGDNKTYSIPLTGRPATIEGSRTTYAFNNTIETGFGKPLDEAGEYDVRFAARDVQGNWNATAPILFKLNDTRAPDLHEAAVDQPLQEVGVNVTFTARVTDQTNVSVKLRVHPAGSDEDVLKVNMTPTAAASQNYTYTANFTREGNYVWEIYAVDSAGLASSVKSGPLSISDNLGPRFQVVEPALLIEGKRYARATPQISVIVSDTHGVDKDSIEMDVGGTRVQHDSPVPTGIGISGYVVNFTVPASLRFQHGDVVTVNVTALDLSGRTLRGWLNFTFTVDDVAPVVRVREFSPRYPTEGTGTVNVSLRTRFTLEATDDDQLPTGVESIRYRIFGGGNNAAETVYGEPFTIADAPGVYTGPKIYQIQYWAVDAAGNQKMVAGRATYETLNVYVDDIPPALDPFGSLPQGRFVNATFIDDRSGVDRAIVWYSVNGAPYVPVQLDFVAGVWTALLPEGRKGDRVAYYLEAFDRVENRESFGNATEPYSTYTVGNHAPTLRITAPVEGSRIARTVDLAWTASDADGDPLTFTVFVKAPGTTAFRELAKLESPDARRYPIVTTDYTDGQYTFRVTASDGSFVSLADTTVSILNRATAFGTVTPPPGEVQPGTPVVLQVEVTKAEAVVKALLFRDNELAQTVDMNDEGRDGDAVARDGKYSARVQLDDDGRYRVEFHAEYPGEDGTTQRATIQGGEFVVDGGVGLGVWLALIGLVVVAGVVVAAVVIVRGRKGA